MGQVPEDMSRCTPGAMPDTRTFSLSDIQSESERLLKAAFADNTTEAYNNLF
ncbi:hypothetical protein DPMN_166403 [Dreissena polymorpha]|uniref:Uncharacterized protein n=1 Tax=Dreissena polymorpha TaxID=45954 RepID=A0A9D4IXV0_DREPO|nr:hypothetical protein DPMN_166403 [Dreissena polymorpha]